MLFQVDDKNVFGRGLDQAGKYNVQITNTALSQSRAGNPKIDLTYLVIDGSYSGVTIQYADTMTWIDETPEALDRSVTRFNDLLVKIGVPNGTRIDTIEDYANGLKGAKLAVVVDWEKSEYGNNAGNYFLRVKRHEKLDPEGSKPNGKKRPNGPQQARTAVSNGNLVNYPNQGQNASNSFNEPNIDPNDLPFN